MTELILTEELTGLSESKAAQIKAVFQPMVKMLEDFEGAYNELMAAEQTNEKSEQAKRLRLEIAGVRIAADKVRKSQKEEYLRAGNAIQGVYNVLKFAVMDKEEKLKEVETHDERIEDERIARVQSDRESELAKYDVITNAPHLGVMADEVWVPYLAGVKLNYEAVKEAERKVEEERIEAERKQKLCREREMQLAGYAQYVNYVVGINTTQSEFDTLLLNAENKKKEHEEEQARIKQENEKLKAEQIKLQKEREEREAELKKEREERAKIERANKDKADRQAEEKRKFELAPDKAKLIKFAELLYYDDNTFKSEAANVAMYQAGLVLISAANKM